MAKTSLIATGDVFITRRLGANGYDGFEEVAEIIRAHDVGFTNLEMTFHDAEGFPAAESGGTWAMTEPGALDDVQRYGFNIYNTANNHSGDYGTGGVLATIKHLKERGMVFSGTGANLAEASRPCYLDTKYARVALISASASFHAAEAAGSQSPDLPGRPGLNPLGIVKRYHADPETFRTLEEIAYKLGIHSSQSASIKNGYTSPPPEGTFKFGAENFVMDTDNFQETRPNPKDMGRIAAEIEEAKKQADIVLVSIHAHAAKALCPQNIPAEFLETFARACVDAGADAILGHGPHELRGIEIYKGKPIFYSLGNFIFQTETVSTQPVDAYLKKGMPADTKVGAYMANRSANGTRGYGTQKPIWKAVMGAFTMEDGKVTGVTLYPVDLGMGMPSSKIGWPRMEHGNETLEYLAELSAAYGTKIRVEDGVGYIDL